MTKIQFINFGRQIDEIFGEITSGSEMLQGILLKDSFKRLIKISLLRLEKRQKSTESSINLSDQAQYSIQQSPQIEKSEDHECEMTKSREEYASSRLEMNLVEMEDPVKKWKSDSNQLDQINLIENIKPADGASLLKRNQIWTWYWPCLKYTQSVWIRIGSK